MKSMLALNKYEMLPTFNSKSYARPTKLISSETC
jgi:hypothetical protein